MVTWPVLVLKDARQLSPGGLCRACSCLEHPSKRHVAPSPPPEAYPEQPTQNSPASPLTSFPAVASPPDTLGTNLSAHLQEPIKCSLGILCDHGHHCAKTPPRTSTSAASENYLWPSQGGCNRGSKAPARTSELEPHRSS